MIVALSLEIVLISSCSKPDSQTTDSQNESKKSGSSQGRNGDGSGATDSSQGQGTGQDGSGKGDGKSGNGQGAGATGSSKGEGGSGSGGQQGQGSSGQGGGSEKGQGSGLGGDGSSAGHGSNAPGGSSGQGGNGQDSGSAGSSQRGSGGGSDDPQSNAPGTNQEGTPFLSGEAPEELDPSRFLKPKEEIKDVAAVIVDAFNLVERNGLWYRKGSSTPYTGVVHRFYPEGKKNWEMNYKEGKRHGRHVIWDEAGKVTYEGRYENGVRVK